MSEVFREKYEDDFLRATKVTNEETQLLHNSQPLFN